MEVKVRLRSDKLPIYFGLKNLRFWTVLCAFHSLEARIVLYKTTKLNTTYAYYKLVKRKGK